jgi:hypothetical protein
VNNVQDLYEQLKQKPFPVLGKHVGDFVLYDSLIAGCAAQASRGKIIPPEEIPAPDKETLRQVAQLRNKDRRNYQEQDFLEYFDLLDKIRHCFPR